MFQVLAKAKAIFCCLAMYEYGYSGKEAGTATGQVLVRPEFPLLYDGVRI